MAFITGAIIGGLASVAGGAIASKGAKKAAKTAAAASEREIEFNRESRDIALEHQRPYREAGYTALDALMSMTGLGGGRPAPTKAIAPVVGRNRALDIMGGPGISEPLKGRGSSWDNPRLMLRNRGGPMSPGTYYNINEVGPENVYANGAITRHQNPVTIDGKTGYVEPNIEGRYAGGPFGSYGMMRPMYEQMTQTGGGFISGAVDKLRQRSSAPDPYMRNEPSRLPPKPATTQRDASGAPIENPGGVEGGFNYQMDPGYNFRFEEGQRALERGAAARGGLLSGGFARQAIRYGQNYASGEYANVYNRIANIAGLGQVANNQSSNAALYAGQGMGQAAGNAGYALGSGQMASTNAWANTVNQLGQLPWGEIFNKPGAVDYSKIPPT